MARRAIWRTAPGDPRSRLGWVAREGNRWAVLVLRKALLGVAGLALYAVAVGAFGAFILATLALLALLRPSFPNDPECPTFADPSPTLTFTGSVEVFREGVLLGEDRVVVTCVEGWLLVEGIRTNFALQSGDVEEIARPGFKTILRLRDESELRFDASPTRERDSRGYIRYVTLLSYLQDWRRDDPAVGDSILPPDRPHPSASARAGTDLTMAALATALTIIACVTFGPWWGVASFALSPKPHVFAAAENLARLRRLSAKD